MRQKQFLQFSRSTIVLSLLIFICIDILLSSSSHGQIGNKIQENPTGSKAMIQEIAEFDDYLIASASYYENPSANSTIRHNSIKYFLIEKQTGKVVQSKEFNSTQDTAYILSNTRCTGDTLNIYFHKHFKHSSSYFRDEVYVWRLNRHIQTIDETKLFDRVISSLYYSAPSYVFEYDQSINEIYVDAYLGISNKLLLHKKYDYSGNVISYKRLNPTAVDSYSNFLWDEGLLQIKEHNDEIYIMAYNLDTSHFGESSRFYSGYNLCHFDLDMNLLHYLPILADTDSYHLFAPNTMPRVASYTYNGTPSIVDVTDSTYTFGGVNGYYYNDTSFWLTPFMNTRYKTDTIEGNLYEYYRDTSELKFNEVGQFGVEEFNFVERWLPPYPLCGSGNSNFITCILYQLKADSLRNSSFRRFYIEVVDKKFENRKKYYYADSNYFVGVNGCMTTAEGFPVVYGLAHNLSDSLYLSVPFILYLDADGNFLNILLPLGDSENKKLSINPVPSHDRIIIKSEETLGTVQIYSADGRLIYSTVTNSNELTLSLADWTSGNYFVSSDHGDAHRTGKIVKN